MDPNNFQRYDMKDQQPKPHNEEFKTPFPSPRKYGSNSTPYSPNPRNRRVRYFNYQQAGTSSGSDSGGSPYNRRPWRKPYRSNYGRNNWDPNDIMNYYDPSALENPWAELEKQLEEEKKKEKLKELLESPTDKKKLNDLPKLQKGKQLDEKKLKESPTV